MISYDKNVDCILNHPDFNAMMNETVLCKVGPLLRSQNGSCYRIKNGADKKYVNIHISKQLFQLPWRNI